MYITAVGDRAGMPSRILDHAPFAFGSHGALIDWYLRDNESSWASRFRLHLVTDIRGLTHPLGSAIDGDRRSLVRPGTWLTRFMWPDAEAITAPVSISLTQAPDVYGWIDLALTFCGDTARIALSEVFDPLSRLLTFLHTERDRDLPIGIRLARKPRTLSSSPMPSAGIAFSSPSSTPTRTPNALQPSSTGRRFSTPSAPHSRAS